VRQLVIKVMNQYLLRESCEKKKYISWQRAQFLNYTAFGIHNFR